MWVSLGLAVFLIGWLPRLGMIDYLFLGFSFMMIYIGTVAELPEWTQKLSPFGHVSRYPVEILEFVPLLVLIGIALVLMIAGVVGYKRRDTV